MRSELLARCREVKELTLPSNTRRRRTYDKFVSPLVRRLKRAIGNLEAAPCLSAEDLYLDLMKKCLTFLIHAPVCLDVRGQGKEAAANDGNWQAREEGRDWPLAAETMIGIRRLDNVQSCVRDVIQQKVPGDLIECGVWRGGASIFMRAILKAYKVTDRAVWLADSFKGLPPPNVEKYCADSDSLLHTVECLRVSPEEVKQNFARYGLLDDQVHLVEGWFRDTLPKLAGRKWAVIRLDGDMYESTMDALTNLYPDLTPGGYAIIDDYGAIPACRQAVQDYRAEHKIQEEIRVIDWTGVFWQKESPAHRGRLGLRTLRENAPPLRIV